MTGASSSVAVSRTRRTLLASLGKATFAIVAGGIFMSPAKVLAQPAARFSGLKTLVLYYSRTGNTRTVAGQIHELIGGDLVEIQTVDPYPDDYDAVVAQNVEEQRSNYKPPLRTTIGNIRDYDVVFVGSPLWNVRLTPPIRSFLSSHDLSGKIIVPFVTYIVSGLGQSRQDIEELCPDSTIVDGLAVLGEDSREARTMVSEWLQNMRLR